MLDIHTQILPGIDDGARDLSESLLMLEREAAQGVDRVALTPHFYAEEHALSSYLNEREAAYIALRDAARAECPELLLGAEVAYYSGISKSDALNNFAIGESRVLLLEMPESVWSEYMIREVEEITLGRGFHTVIAHAERCLDYQSKKNRSRLYDAGILIQSNASFFINPKTRRQALKLLGRGEIHFVASDAHGSDYRPSRIGEAIGIIEDKLGRAAIERLDSISSRLFGEAVKQVY
jgi:protein-tyrosine phosphatase